jgi:hypothetical protein
LRAVEILSDDPCNDSVAMERNAPSRSTLGENLCLMRPLFTADSKISRIWLSTKIRIQKIPPKNGRPSHGKPKAIEEIDRLVKGDEPISEKLKESIDDHS